MCVFYERLVGYSKMVLWKLIRKKYLTQLQLQTFFSEIEVVLNLRPLVYVEDELNNGITITPSYFLTLNTEKGTPSIEGEDKGEELDYELKNTSSK